MGRYRPGNGLSHKREILAGKMSSWDLFRDASANFSERKFERAYYFCVQTPSDKEVDNRALLSILKDFSLAYSAPSVSIYERYASRALRKIGLYHDNLWIQNADVASLRWDVESMKKMGEKRFDNIPNDLLVSYTQFFRFQEKCVEIEDEASVYRDIMALNQGIDPEIDLSSSNFEPGPSRSEFEVDENTGIVKEADDGSGGGVLMPTLNRK